MSDDMETAFEKYRAKKFGAYSSYPVDAWMDFCAGWEAALGTPKEQTPDSDNTGSRK